jgi:hypothetical protein
MNTGIKPTNITIKNISAFSGGFTTIQENKYGQKRTAFLLSAVRNICNLKVSAKNLKDMASKRQYSTSRVHC